VVEVVVASVEVVPLEPPAAKAVEVTTVVLSAYVVVAAVASDMLASVGAPVVVADEVARLAKVATETAVAREGASVPTVINILRLDWLKLEGVIQ
jgi:hypothetical protein